MKTRSNSSCSFSRIMLPLSLWLFSLMQMKYEMGCATIYSLKTETATYPLNMLSSSYQDSWFYLWWQWCELKDVSSLPCQLSVAKTWPLRLSSCWLELLEKVQITKTDSESTPTGLPHTPLFWCKVRPWILRPSLILRRPERVRTC